MRAAHRQTDNAAIDFSAPLKFDGAAALRKRIASYVQGVRGTRQNAVTERQILRWFRGTPEAFVKARLSEVCASGQVRCCAASLGSARRHDGAYAYEAAEQQSAN